MCTQSVDLVICDCPEGFAGKQCQTGDTCSTHTVYTLHECSTVLRARWKTSTVYATCTKGSIVFTSYREYRIFWDSWHWYIIECKLQQSTYCNLVNDRCSLILSVHGTYVRTCMWCSVGMYLCVFTNLQPSQPHEWSRWPRQLVAMW